MGIPSNRILNRARSRKNFHIHTTFSDGKFGPDQLILMAKKANRKHISLTDHDNFKAYVETDESGAVRDRKFGGKTIRDLARTPTAGGVKRLRVTPGAEFNCIHNGTKIEVLGYHFNMKGKGMLELQNKTMAAACNRVEQRISYLKGLGFKIELKEIDPFNFANLDEELLRPENSALLHRLAPDKKNPVLSLRSFLFQGEGSPYAKAVKEDFVHANLVIDKIRKNGGIAVLAHPLQYFRNLPIHEQEEKIETLVRGLKMEGLRGMEAEYSIRQDNSYYSVEEMKMLKRVARRNHLKIFGGTDFHFLPRDKI